MIGSRGSRLFGGGSFGDSESPYGFVRAYYGEILKIPSTDEERQDAERERWLDNSKILYHYTSLKGLMGIVETGGFWASDNRFMNDSEELIHGVYVTIALIDSHINNCTSAEFCDVLKSARESLAKPLGSGQLVTCFSLSEDSLEQWRGYGMSSGVCIALDTTRTDCVPIFSNGLSRHRVFYQDRDKRDFVLSKILRFQREFLSDAEKFGEPPPQDVREKYGAYLVSSMANAIAGFKNASFSSEAEVRIVIPFESARHFMSGLQFRESTYGPVAYVNTADYVKPTGLLDMNFLQSGSDVDKTTNLLPIVGVTVGPSARQDLVVESLKTFLGAKGYSDVEVKPSKVPFRGA